MTRSFVWGMVWLATATVGAAENLVRNPGFEEPADRNGLPQAWQLSGNRQRVAQTLSVDRGRDGKQCGRLACTRFAAGTPDSHAMICQMGVPVKQGVSYRLTLWARAEALAGDTVDVALSDTSRWDNCGLQDSFAPGTDWARFEFFFRATRTCGESTRFQIWFNSTGTLWLDDVELVELGRDVLRPGKVVSAVASINLLPNASFECGTDGWGSTEGDRVVHWGGRMNRLFGELDTTQAQDGKASLKIALTPETQPVSYFDYYELARAPIRAPLAGNLGFMEIEPGKPYTFSVFMKADRPDTPARLRIQQFQGGYTDKAVRVSTQWQRFSLTIKPWAKWCYVLAGPDLCPGKENPNPPDRATVWLDAAQWEQADRPSAFRTRSPIEFGIATGKPGNVFDWGEPVRFVATVHRSGNEDRPAQVRFALTDFFDKEVQGRPDAWEVPAGKDQQLPVSLPPDPRRRGFLRLVATLTAGSETETLALRLAVIPTYHDKDSRFGVNHAYPWPHLLDLSRKAGLVWVRDWSLKWQQVEPEPGKFQFTETDDQVDRPRKHGLKVLGLLPFPSSNWSSSAPASVTAKGPYPQNRARAAYAPRDEAEFEKYVATAVAHYRDRVHWWQVFNEPLFTDYSLPRKLGYDGATYARLTKAFARAARKTDPQCRVLAGIGYLNEGQILEDFDTFFAHGGLEAADAVDIHHYPGIRRPEFLEGLLTKLNALMEKHGGRKPIWLTEYGYYADDEPASVPLEHHGFDQSVGSERRQAEYAVRWAAIGLAGGIQKIFYHAGTSQAMNADNLEGVFYKYGGQPRRIYAAQAVLAHLLSPATRFVRPLALDDGVKAFLFRDGERLVAVVWAAGRAKPGAVRLADQRLQLRDIMGRTQAAREFAPSDSPVYVVAQGVADDTFAKGIAARANH